MCHPPTPALKLKQETVRQDKLKQVKKVRFDMNVNIFSLSDNNKSKPAISNELLIKSMVNNFYKVKLDQSLLQIKSLENELQQFKSREKELEEIIYNLKKLMDDLLIKKNEITLMSRRESLINILPNVSALPSTTV